MARKTAGSIENMARYHASAHLPRLQARRGGLRLCELEAPTILYLSGRPTVVVQTGPGIITAADLTRQFGNHARPFALIEEAEDRLRRAAAAFTVEELRQCVPNHQKAKVFDVTDLTFGNYYYLLKDANRRKKLARDIDHEIFLRLPDDTRRVRNEIMRFAPDSISEEQYDAVHGLLDLLRTVDPVP